MELNFTKWGKEKVKNLVVTISIAILLCLCVYSFFSLIFHRTSQYTFTFANFLPCHLPGVQVDALTFGVCMNLEWSPFF